MRGFLTYLIIGSSLIALSLGVLFSKNSQAFFSSDSEQRVQILEEMIYNPDYLDLTNALIDSLQYCPSEIDQVNNTLNLLREYTFSLYNKEITVSKSGKKLFDEILVLLEQQITVEITELKELCPAWLYQSTVHGAAEAKQSTELTIEERINTLDEKCDRRNVRAVQILRKRVNANRSSNSSLKRIERQLKKLEKRCQISPTGVAQASKK
jgi:hypothetical protein